MDNQITVNRLPSKTWNWLKVNQASVPWDQEQTVDLGTEQHSFDTTQPMPVRIVVETSHPYVKKQIHIEARAGVSVTVYETFQTAHGLQVQTNLTVGEGAAIRLVQVQDTQPGAVLVSQVNGQCEKGGRIEVYQVLAGRGDVYLGGQVDLNGDGSSLKSETGYLGRKGQTIDIGIAVNHYGKKTESEMNASGALKDDARKIFRGTIDFKKGCADSTGNEKETVLMLGQDAVNKTVPLILCAEENVVGNHGATIGEMDKDTLFYFESRGIDRQSAENMLARAAIERLAHLIGDEETQATILSQISEEC